MDRAARNAALGRAWIKAFNAHDVARLVKLYAFNATHTSPKIRALHPETGGCLTGHVALTSWWSDAIARLPSLRYELTAVTANDERVVIEYLRHVDGAPPMPVAEAFDIEDGLIVASRVFHG